MSETEQPRDPGLMALVMVLRFHGVAADPAQIRHQLGMAPVGVAEMVRIAKQFDLQARVRTTTWSRLAHTPMPAIAALRDGGFVILGKVDEDGAIVQRGPRPELMSRSDLKDLWDDRLVMMCRRSVLPDLFRRFD